MNNLMQTYKEKIVPKLVAEFGFSTPQAVPSIRKVVVNMGIGDAKDSREEQTKILSEVATIVGQKPSIRLARKAIAGFGIRQGQPVGVSATLRGQRMYDFLLKLFVVVLPRIRDFKGVSKGSIDRGGNYTLGISEHTVFPEIDLGNVGKIRGLEITLETTTSDPKKAERLLEELGMPFEKEEKSG